MIDPQDLRKVEILADLRDDDLRWLAERGTPILLEPGDALFEEGDPADTLLALIDGEVRIRRERGEPDDRWIVRSGGKITGALPLSRLTHAPVTARALVPTHAMGWSKPVVAEMLERIPILNARLASVMLDRSREFTRLDEQRQRLMSLGKLSAGLAHELNNPAAAIQRHLDELSRRMVDLSDVAVSELEHRVASDRLASLRDVATRDRPSEPGSLDPLARSDAQEALASWLGDRGVPDAWRVAETLVDGGVTANALGEATRDAPSDVVPSIALWAEAVVATRRLLDEMGQATRRVVDLIASVKAYSNLDRSEGTEPLDVNEGIRSTWAMLEHAARERRLVLEAELDPGIPSVTANAGELNQVWTNLLDNAIDASPEGGTIVVRSEADGDEVRVRVIDAGPGVPADVQPRIFEPFFTTKDVGEGRGLGLADARRIVHGSGGTVHLTSRPGRTCFEVRLPATPAQP